MTEPAKSPLDLGLDTLDELLLRKDDPVAEERRAAALVRALMTLERAASMDPAVTAALEVVRREMVGVHHRISWSTVRGAARRARRWTGVTSSVERVTDLVSAARAALMASADRATWDALAAGIATARKHLDEVARLLEG